MIHRWELINRVINSRGFKRYLEIGVKDGVCWNRVDCSVKAGVDIKPLIIKPTVYRMSSDEYFYTVHGREKFEIIFIDGDHREAQVDRDVQNSLRCLMPGGVIVMHDCNPKKAGHANEEREAGQIIWNGTTYRSFLKLRKSASNLKIYVVEIDCGCGIIQRGRQRLTDIPDDYTWDDFDKNRVEWLNLISVDEFERRFP